jgi:ABC-type dipeptide/oligopeptide/nickel transport system permease subunit
MVLIGIGVMVLLCGAVIAIVYGLVDELMGEWRHHVVMKEWMAR